MITLIANSGIQFYSKQITLNLKDKVIPTQHYWQRKFEDQGFVLEEEIKKYQLDLAHQDEDGRIVPKLLLEFDLEGNLDRNKTNFSVINALPSEEVISINKIKGCIEQYKSHWIPIPFFKQNPKNNQIIFGPTGWARMMLNEVEQFTDEEENKCISFKVNIAFDTSPSNQDGQKVTLDEEDTIEGNNLFALSGDVDQNISFFSSKNDCQWIDDYLLSIIHKGKLPENDKPLKYIANYLYLIQFLANLKEENEIQKVILYPNSINTAVDVDLILDIGNARTCGLLFEGTPNKTSYNFTSVQKLEIANLTSPGIFYTDPFSMRLAFCKASFGDIDVPQYPKLFAWPSVLRVGVEARQILNGYDISNQITSEPAITLSSPKRYLWDTKISEKPWEFIPKNKLASGRYERKHVSIDYLSTQFTREGTLVEKNNNLNGSNDHIDIDTGHGVEPKWSRSSLMTFVMIEIINHAMRQINSHNFRLNNDAFIAKSRKLRTIVITCPTGMTELEQVQLRNAAKHAVEALKRYHIEVNTTSNSNNKGFDLSGFNISEEDLGSSFSNDSGLITETPFSNIEIVPDAKEIAKPLDKLDSREDWIYDESSASQINFIYGEVVKKYRQNYRKFFEIYGKKSSSKSEVPDSLTIASVDIGGGTTDLMICNYTYEKNQHNLNLIPNPLYWETFNLAGDDLLKEIINQVLIDGKKINENKYTHLGLIREHAKEKNCSNITNKILFFFGEQGVNQGAGHRFFRKNFIHQILVPIATKLLDELASNKSTTIDLEYDQIFKDSLPNEQLIEYVNKHFGNQFDFKSIRWNVTKEKLNEIIRVKFSERFKQISSLAFACKVDFLLISGKPSALAEVRNIFVRTLPLTPERIISLSDYFIGKWYPFNEKGKLKDAKTTVAVGAMLYTLAGKYRNLDGFRIDTKKLKQKLISTADYLGAYNSVNGGLNSIFLDDKIEEYTITENLPITIGFKQLDVASYPARPIYELDFNEQAIADKIKNANPTYNEVQVKKATQNRLREWRNTKYNIEISRDFEKSKENIKIVSVEAVDSIGVLPSIKDFELRLMTSNEPKGYWLDTGEFITLHHQE